MNKKGAWKLLPLNLVVVIVTVGVIVVVVGVVGVVQVGVVQSSL